jgi:chemotaxis protein MotB
MGKKKKCPEPDCPKCLPGWLAAFGDLMSLLLCFFVLLLSMSTMDAKKVQEAVGSLSGALSVLEGGTKTEISKERQQETTPIDQDDETAQKIKTMKRTIIEVNEMMKNGSADGTEVTLHESEDGFMIRLPAKLLFKAGEAKIENEDAILFLKRIALIIDKLPKHLHINIVGHTDDSAMESIGLYRGNWSLSAERAISVAHQLIKSDIEPKLITAGGKAEFEPIASNLTPEGKEKNRRVELYFFSKNKEDKEGAQKSILDGVPSK